MSVNCSDVGSLLGLEKNQHVTLIHLLYILQGISGTTVRQGYLETPRDS